MRNFTISMVGRRTSTKYTRMDGITWEGLKNGLSQSNASPETLNEFLALPKAEQDSRKDGAAILAGAALANRRGGKSCEFRSCLTLDADNLTPDTWAALRMKLEMFFPFAWCVYSTRKHSPEAPRVRLVVPLAVNVSPTVYEATARTVCLWLDHSMTVWDRTTCQPDRIMYLGSHCADIEPVWLFHDGAFLDASAMLRAEAVDPNNFFTWPLFPYEWPFTRPAGKQLPKDPTEGDDMPGLFCRVYDIDSAIAKYLSDIYAPAGSSRYTYVKGSSYGGAVVYEDGAFLFSHHSTDPANTGHLMNAFDLVRVHKFGELDRQCKAKTPINKRPSYRAMCDLVAHDVDCQEQRAREVACKLQNYRNWGC